MKVELTNPVDAIFHESPLAVRNLAEVFFPSNLVLVRRLREVGGTPFKQNLTRVRNLRFEAEIRAEIVTCWWPRSQA